MVIELLIYFFFFHANEVFYLQKWGSVLQQAESRRATGAYKHKSDHQKINTNHTKFSIHDYFIFFVTIVGFKSSSAQKNWTAQLYYNIFYIYIFNHKFVSATCSPNAENK